MAVCRALDRVSVCEVRTERLASSPETAEVGVWHLCGERRGHAPPHRCHYCKEMFNA